MFVLLIAKVQYYPIIYIFLVSVFGEQWFAVVRTLLMMTAGISVSYINTSHPSIATCYTIVFLNLITQYCIYSF